MRKKWQWLGVVRLVVVTVGVEVCTLSRLVSR
jgi:hypothetical protein